MNFLLNRLSIMHRNLDIAIKQEAKQRLPDFVRLLRLKKMRLALKDKIARRIKLRALHPHP
jgi:hypothetical protein